jgi:hypothetical protein
MAFYGDGRTPLRTEDLIEIGKAGRRCCVCRSGHGIRRFKLVRAAGQEPIAVCGSCRARFGNDPPVARKPAAAVEAVPEPAEPLAAPREHPDKRAIDQRPDRLTNARWVYTSSFRAQEIEAERPSIMTTEHDESKPGDPPPARQRRDRERRLGEAIGAERRLSSRRAGRRRSIGSEPDPRYPYLTHTHD